MGEANFGLDIGYFEKIFNISNINDGSSLNLLNQIKGPTDLCEALKVNINSGISTDPVEINLRKLAFGQNSRIVREKISILRIILKVSSNEILLTLIVASVISLIIGIIQSPSDGWYEGVGILTAVIIIVFVTTVNDYTKESQFIKLNHQTDIHNVIVMREGIEVQIPAHDLLVGDLMFITPGEIFPVDGILLKGDNLAINQSTITGESELVYASMFKHEETNSSPFLISGTKLSDGNGMMIVCTVGQNTINEKIRSACEKLKEENTPFQTKLIHFASGLGILGFIVGFLVTLILIVYMSVRIIEDGYWGSYQWKELVNSIIIGITILIVVIPEGMPLALTLAAVYSIIKMKDEHIFVRYIKGCETMGAITNILCDKTGTLTLNSMKAIKLVLFDQFFEEINEVSLKPEKKTLFCECISRNSTAFIIKNSNDNFEVIGNRTEGALLEIVEAWGYNFRDLRNNTPIKSQFAFTSESKKMTSVYKAHDDHVIVYSKGSAETILSFCEFYASENQDSAEITQKKRQEIKEMITLHSSQGLRVIGLCYKVLIKKSEEISRNEAESNMIFIGFVGLEDPLRPEARETIIKSQNAGIKIRMVTGDNIETAISVAKQSNILPFNLPPEKYEEYVIEGKYFREKVGGLKVLKNEKENIEGLEVGNIEEFKDLARNLTVIARCSPEDKLLLVIGLKQLGEVVLLIGDGSNDAPSLSQSDLGISMMSGTQMAKESSDVIFLDDNFKSILNSLMWGRNLYESIRKFLQFQLTITISSSVIIILGSGILQTSPFTAIQMLWVNLIMDSLAALALATAKPTEEMLNSKPETKSDSFINADMYIIIISQSLYQIIVLLIILFAGPSIFGIKEGWGNEDWDEENGKHFTILFHTFVMLQLFNEINCRKIFMHQVNVFRGIFNNIWFIGILFSTFGVQILIVEFGGKPFQCTRLSIEYHTLSVGLGLIGLVFGIFLRFLFYYFRIIRKKSKNSYLEKEKYPLLPNLDFSRENID